MVYAGPGNAVLHSLTFYPKSINASQEQFHQSVAKRKLTSVETSVLAQFRKNIKIYYK